MDTVLCTTTFLIWILTISSGFVLISSASEEIDFEKTFEPGTSLIYEWRSTVLLDGEYGNSSAKKVGFSISGTVTVETVWGEESGGDRIIKVKLESPQLHIKSRKSSSADGFLPHASNIENLQNKPFLIIWNKGIIRSVWLSENENVALANMKKGIASLLQVQSSKGQSSELDISGNCKVDYKILSSTAVTKEKSECTADDDQNRILVDEILGLDMSSKRTATYQIGKSTRTIDMFLSRETHLLKTKLNQRLQSILESEQILRLKDSKKCEIISEDGIGNVIKKISEKDNVKFAEQHLKSTKERTSENTTKFAKEVESHRRSLEPENLGTIKSAKAFLSLKDSARNANKEDISKALNSKKNNKILEQLFDILGYTQTKNSHNAAMKVLHLDSEEKNDLLERYLWALSLSPHPNADILEDLLNKYRKYTTIPTKIKHTLILSLASMARSLRRNIDLKGHDILKVLKTTEETIINELDYVKGEEKFIYFAALKNLHSPTTIPILIKYIKNGSTKDEVLAWKALKSFDKQYWTPELLKLAEKTLFQLDKKHDSSARTLAADIILESDVSEAKVEDILKFVASNETNYEIKQYVFQSIKMLSDKDESLNKNVQKIIKNSPYLNNYSGLAPRGISTALRRNIFTGLSSNGSFVSVQEIQSGIVKRGAVDVILDKDGTTKQIFSLGLFTNGLTSFVSSEEEENSPGEEENTTAGMELTIMGTQIRPFVFFDGQGELMGHVWSGTASEMTTAFQANILLQDHSETIRLGNGFIAEFSLNGAVSFDLSGKIEMSLWSRNAQSLIEKSAGYLVNGQLRVDSSIVNSMVEFNASVEPKLSLQIDADFSSGMKMCMRLLQPDTIFRHNIHKMEKIPNNRLKIRISKYMKCSIPGRTYALNRKNNEMCSSIFS